MIWRELENKGKTGIRLNWEKLLPKNFYFTLVVVFLFYFIIIENNEFKNKRTLKALTIWSELENNSKIEVW